MLEFLINIAQFALQSLIIVIALIVIIGFIATLINKGKEKTGLKAKNLNKQFKKQRDSLNKNILDKKEFKKIIKKEKQDSKKENVKPRLFVLNFEGDIKASAVTQLRQEVSALLMVAKADDQVLLNLESPGGMVHGYGLAASQLQRIKERGLHLSICVDKVAASGGYMMACIGDKIISAPFAIIGSIGVVASMPNFNKILKKNDVDYLEITAGEYKRTLTPLGEITEPGMTKFKQQIEEVHDLFKNHVSKFRPQADIAKVATGEYWYGQQAKELNLVDDIGTSDDFIINNMNQYDIIEVKFEGKKGLKEKLAEGFSHATESLADRVLNMNWRSGFF